MIEIIAEAWRAEIFSTHDWRMNTRRDPAQGILDGAWLKLDAIDEAPYGAYFKPTLRCDYPAAAREKIAADLAHDLGVPAVPVLLCDSGGRFGAQQEECCVSLVTHPRVEPWPVLFTKAMQESIVGEAIRAAAREPLSRIAVFDMWIGNPDRDNLGNVIYCQDDASPERDGFRALDHSAAMGGVTQAWRNDGWANVAPTPFPEPMRPLLDKDSMLRMVETIRSVTEIQLRACVDRIPDRYMDESTRNDLVNGLAGRKSHLAALVLQYPTEG